MVLGNQKHFFYWGETHFFFFNRIMNASHRIRNGIHVIRNFLHKIGKIISQQRMVPISSSKPLGGSPRGQITPQNCKNMGSN